MSIEIQYDKYRPKVCAFYAGRAWYAGVPSGPKLGWVLFSQVLMEIANIGKCYQQNDPTSEIFSDLLDSDGGVIQIPEAGEIVGLTPVGPVLIVFASNGVWQISGGRGVGFTAASYVVEKVTNIGCLFQKSIVSAEDVVFYWSSSGIHAVSIDQEGRARVADISEQKIKTFYQSIPSINKKYVDGKYNASDKTIYWAYNNNDASNTSEGLYKKNRILAFNVQLQSFYTITLDQTAGPVTTALAVTKETIETSITFSVVAGADEVVVDADEVVCNTTVVQGAVKQYKFLTYATIEGVHCSTWSDFLQGGVKDWYTYNNVGVNVDGYILTGYNVGGSGPARSKTAQYVNVFAKRTETGFDADANPENEGGIYMQTRWDFTDNVNPGKWSDEVQVYRPRRPFLPIANMDYDDGYPLVTTKNKVRGRGKALQVKFRNEPGKQMHLVGWSIGFVNNTNV